MKTTWKSGVGMMFVVGVLGGMSVLIAKTGCGGDPPMGAPDMASGMVTSCCGKAGDPGNEKGVGQYCTENADCTNAFAFICSAKAAPAKRTFFCTTACNPDAGATVCGTGATCIFDTSFSAYGCVPSTCLASLPAGCTL